MGSVPKRGDVGGDSTQTSFSYEALTESDSIRLLRLQPGLTGQEISSLSYVWGNPEIRTKILIDGQPFKITVNLAAALDDLRDERRPLLLWADALCIDQSNIRERNHQIGYMRDIYALAQQTIVYLGEMSEESAYAWEKLRFWYRGEMNDRFDSLELLKKHVRKVAAASLLSRPWFSRVWVYQELVLSKEVWVQCGRNRMKWDHFCKLLPQKEIQPNEYLNKSQKYRSSDDSRWSGGSFQVLEDMRSARLKYILSRLNKTEPESLLSVLLARRGFGVTDPRDLVYGHLAVAGLYDPTRADPLHEVDYNKTVAEVFTDAAVYIINSTRSNRVFLHVEATIPSLRRQNLPSWVPDWSLSSSYYLPSIRGWNILPEEFQSGELPAIYGSKLIVKQSQERTIIAFRGWSIGTIAAIGQLNFQKPANFDAEVEELTALHSSWLWNLSDRKEQEARRLKFYGKIYQLWKAKLGRISLPPFASYLGKTSDYENFWRVAEDLYAKNVDLRGSLTPIILRSFPSDEFRMGELLMRQTFGLGEPEVFRGRKQATLVEGGIVLVPAETQPGDILYYQPLGNEMHFTVLRPLLSYIDPRVQEDIKRHFSSNKGTKLKYFTLIGAGSVGADCNIGELIFQTTPASTTHIVALL